MSQTEIDAVTALLTQLASDLAALAAQITAQPGPVNVAALQAAAAPLDASVKAIAALIPAAPAPAVPPAG